MEPKESRSRVGVILAAPISVLLGVLFFMPWLTVSCDGQAALELNEDINSPQVAAIVGTLDASGEVARASGIELARGEITPCGPLKGQDASAATGQSLTPRSWVYAALVLPGAMLLLCLLCLTGAIEASTAGKGIFLMAFVGAVMMFAVSRINYADDMIDRVEDMIATARPSYAVPASPQIGELSEQLNAVILTTPTLVLWVTMGLYAAACVCGVLTIGPPTPASERAMAKSTVAPGQHDFQFAQSPSRPGASRDRRRAPGGMPQLGPDLFTDSNDRPGANTL